MLQRLSLIQRLGITFLLPLAIIAAINWRLVATIGKYYLTPPRSVGQTSQLEEKQEDNTLAITSIGLVTPVIPSSVDPMAVTDWSKIRNDLMRGVSLSLHQGEPGGTGTTAVIGHSSDWSSHPYATVFANLNKVSEGDIISVRYNDTIYRYSVTQKEVVDPNDISYFQSGLTDTRDHNQLKLITCWPLLTTAKRLVVSASPLPQ